MKATDLESAAAITEHMIYANTERFLNGRHTFYWDKEEQYVYVDTVDRRASGTYILLMALNNGKPTAVATKLEKRWGNRSFFPVVGSKTTLDEAAHLATDLAKRVTDAGPLPESTRTVLFQGEDLERPARYMGKKGDLIDAFEGYILTREEMIGAYKFNIMKYTKRFDQKNGLEDLDKAEYYITRLKHFLETEGLNDD